MASWRLACTILLSHSQWHSALLCLIISACTTISCVICYQVVIFLGWHILKWDSQVSFINLIITSHIIVQKYVKKDASDLIDISMCAEEILTKHLSFPLYISINMPSTCNCFFFFTGIRLNLSRPSLSSDSSKWKRYLCTSRVNRQRKMPEICLTVWALGPFNLVVLGLLPATLYVCILNGAQLLLKSQEESSLQSKEKKEKTRLFPDNAHGAPHICLAVGFHCMSGWSAPQVLLHSPLAPLASQKKLKKKIWSNGNRSKLRVNCFTVDAQQINKHLEAFRAAH